MSQVNVQNIHWSFELMFTKNSPLLHRRDPVVFTMLKHPEYVTGLMILGNIHPTHQDPF